MHAWFPRTEGYQMAEGETSRALNDSEYQAIIEQDQSSDPALPKSTKSRQRGRRFNLRIARRAIGAYHRRCLDESNVEGENGQGLGTTQDDFSSGSRQGERAGQHCEAPPQRAV
ncbi:hypothetical protein NITLEN_100012 [Nitrospira lenta]|uniref:Uncharacterized protein n=1 Tax=Nitrospira lenta TaxID=1436998 RepID=A0A330L389_9BACT|nr:hypothetical protein NITLEN_100012 [Nitrospira lenta]